MLRQTKTENGLVRGLPGNNSRITVYKGIPFAAPPVGDLRWRAPRPVENWEGVRNCFEFGPIAMQETPGLDPNAFYSKEWHVDPEIPMSEDCLYLNVWTPAKSADEKLPVMVWIYGGGLLNGYTAEMEFNGERIASRGVILVSVAYRVNAFGLISHPEITKENPDAPGNLCLVDQNYALSWVQRNIEYFGGDKDNVTIFGQSAGGMSVLTHLTSPKSKGLFKKAIVQSIGGIRPKRPKNLALPNFSLEEAEAEGIKFFDVLGVKTLEEARKLPAQFIEDKFNEQHYFWGYINDGVFMPKSAEQIVIDNEMNDAIVMIGNTTDEFPIDPFTDDKEGIDAWIKDIFGEYADDYFKVLDNIEGDYHKKAKINQLHISNLIFAEVAAKQGRKVYTYEFGPTIPGDNAGVYHSADLWFCFENLMNCWRPFDGHHYDLARKMCNYWTNFAKYGDPNGNDHDGTPMPTWKEYKNDHPFVMNFFDEISCVDGKHSEKVQFLLDINKDMYE